MQRHRARRASLALFGATVLAEAAAIGLSWGLEPALDTVLYAGYSVGMAAAGAAIATRHPRNPIGWLFGGFALLNAVAADLVQGYALRGAVEGWPGVAGAEWISLSSWLPSGWGWLVAFLLFPDGRLPGRRWRWVVVAGTVGAALALPGWSLDPARGELFTGGRNPLAVPAFPAGPVLAVGMTLFLAAFAASAVSLGVRLRRAQGLQRQQLVRFTAAAGVAVVALSLAFALWSVTPVGAVLAAGGLIALPLAAADAMLRHRLYDIDVVIDRTVVHVGVTALLTVGYGVTTVLLGAGFGGGSAWVTAAATLLVAVAFHPLRDGLQQAFDRRFRRARSVAVRRMEVFLQQVREGRADPGETEALLQELTGDEHLRLLLYLPASEVYVDCRGEPAAPADAGPPRERLAVERGGSPVGAVEHTGVAHPPLLRAVVGAGGLAIEIARLQVELRRQVAEVEASRARVVAAGLEERRRLARDLHDGAQQRLVAVGLALRHAQHELGTSAVQAEEAAHTLDEAVDQVGVTIRELRDLARGLPPAPLHTGLAAAFTDLARGAPVPVHLTVPSLRLDRGVEAAAYFIGCEGVTNAVKHAQASRIDLRAVQGVGRLVVTVSDDGVGGAVPGPGSGLTGLLDRVAALGGSLRIDSGPGAGTTLTAELPCAS